jgi:hypothetical protein
MKLRPSGFTCKRYQLSLGNDQGCLYVGRLVKVDPRIILPFAVMLGRNPMSTAKQTIVICGATGKQGGAALNSLSGSPHWRLVALTRNPDGKQAQALKSRGVAVRRADFQDKESLVQAFAGAYGVYGVTTPLTPKGKIDTQMEWEQGRNIADACARNNIQHLVLSTVLYINEAQKAVPYVNSKQEIERYVAQDKIPYTIIRPTRQLCWKRSAKAGNFCRIFYGSNNFYSRKVMRLDCNGRNHNEAQSIQKWSGFIFFIRHRPVGVAGEWGNGSLFVATVNRSQRLLVATLIFPKQNSAS